MSSVLRVRSSRSSPWDDRAMPISRNDPGVRTLTGGDPSVTHVFPTAPKRLRLVCRRARLHSPSISKGAVRVSREVVPPNLSHQARRDLWQRPASSRPAGRLHQGSNIPGRHPGTPPIRASRSVVRAQSGLLQPRFLISGWLGQSILIVLNRTQRKTKTHFLLLRLCFSTKIYGIAQAN